MKPAFIKPLVVFSVLFLIWIAPLVSAQEAPVTVQAENRQPKGWMRDGWGSYRLSLKNTSSLPVRVFGWKAHWEVGGKAFEETLEGKIDASLAPGGSMERTEIGHLPALVASAARADTPVVTGTVTVQQNERTFSALFHFTVPEAVLPEPLKLIRGRTAGMALMRSRYRTFRYAGRALHWVDQCYAAMIDLTGEHPFGGKLMVFKESPPHPWWAYAGQEMILNTDFVAGTVKDFDAGILSFGWIHEVGHNFDDTLGDWYIWSGPAAEFQANFKLCYAVEMIQDQSFHIRWRNGAPAYDDRRNEIPLTGKELIERFFLLFGDAYLADPQRSWESLSSDEMHSLFQRLQRVYGWDLFKRWYRIYRRLQDRGLKPPATPIEKVDLIVAILNEETHADLVPVFQRWRFPVTAEKVKEMQQRYALTVPKAAVLP